MDKWTTLPADDVIKKTIDSLSKNGITAEVAENGDEAKQKVLSLVPEKKEVMTMTSVTLDTIGIPKEINESGKYDSVRQKLNAMNRQTDSLKMQKLGAAPEYTVGSVHAVTQDGRVVIASNTGSQLPAYAYASAHVIWVVGTQKIVKDFDEGMKRIYEYVLPLESKRSRKAYGLPDSWNSNVSKLLIINKELVTGRLHIIFVKELLGF